MVMVTKEIIKSEIERVPEERLEELYEVVKVYSRAEAEKNGDTLFSKLRNIKIDGPEDFSCNFGRLVV
jgi:hypothetical protein